MEDKSDIELLREFAKSTGRSIEVNETPYPRTGVRTTQKYKRMVYMPNNKHRSSFFIWFNDPYSKVGQTTIFSGAFIPLPSKMKSQIKIRNRYILDKINLFSTTKEHKTGNGHFDSKVLISGTVDSESKRLLASTKIQKQIMMAMEDERHYQISMNQFKINFVPELKDKPYFSIIDSQGWVIEKSNIEKMFDTIEKIREMIK